MIVSSEDKPMSYYHVLVEFRNAPKKVRCIFADLTAKELETKFLKPYRQGKTTLAGTEVIDVMAITSARIIKTSHTSDIELQELQQKSHKKDDEFNRGFRTGFLVSTVREYAAEDIEKTGTNVTAHFIDPPPGQDRENFISKMINNDWVRGIVVGIVVAGIVAWLGWG